MAHTTPSRSSLVLLGSLFSRITIAHVPPHPQIFPSCASCLAVGVIWKPTCTNGGAHLFIKEKVCSNEGMTHGPYGCSCAVGSLHSQQPQSGKGCYCSSRLLASMTFCNDWPTQQLCAACMMLSICVALPLPSPQEESSASPVRTPITSCPARNRQWK